MTYLGIFLFSSQDKPHEHNMLPYLHCKQLCECHTYSLIEISMHLWHSVMPATTSVDDKAEQTGSERHVFSSRYSNTNQDLIRQYGNNASNNHYIQPRNFKISNDILCEIN